MEYFGNTHEIISQSCVSRNRKNISENLIRELRQLPLKTGTISLKAENCELSPKENYLLAFHPHGVLSLSAICTFGANLDDYRDIFPGMNSYLCTLPVWFRVPFFREMLMARIIHAKTILKISKFNFKIPRE